MFDAILREFNNISGGIESYESHYITTYTTVNTGTILQHQRCTYNRTLLSNIMVLFRLEHHSMELEYNL